MPVPARPSAPVAVIDVGSNSIKVLVVGRAGGTLRALRSHTLDARIGAGISQEKPMLSEESMTRGLGAIRELLAEAADFAPSRIVLVATSAVRDAANGAEFQRRVKAATGRELRILSGEEEANLIGRGLTCDPGLAGLENFYVFDLGGGSLECLAFRQRRIEQAVSLPLGCVRLTEMFVADPAQPFAAEAREQVAALTRRVLADSKFAFNLPAAAGVATGGTVSTVRAMFGARSGRSAEAAASVITLTQLRSLRDALATLTLSQRQQIPGLPPSRADVFPAALTTLIALAEAAQLTEFRHSFYNLRWGLAAQAFDG
ncbi:MAG: phosphatase [Opitutaceae bacterium]|nr:phosphatase [Opitutaceae bacterium]